MLSIKKELCVFDYKERKSCVCLSIRRERAVCI